MTERSDLHRFDTGMTGGPVNVANAGLVILWPFLGQLFKAFDMLVSVDTGHPRLRNAETQTRAVHMTQYLVAGQTETPEHLLALNKILCGVLIETPVGMDIILPVNEKALCNDLLRTVPTHWPQLDQTSIEGLRQSFLQRDGQLAYGNDRWLLNVKPKDFDMVLDRLPWLISTIRTPWMDAPIFVKWRA